MPIVTQVDLLKIRRTKIIATLGPASCSPETISRLIAAGVNIFRLNMSHGDHDFHRHAFQLIRTAAQSSTHTVGILADLCGPKIRTGKFKQGAVHLQTGSRVTVTTRHVEGESGVIPSQYQALADDVQTGNRILLSDGALELEVQSVSGTEISCTVVHGGELKSHKGINLPGVSVSAPSLTEKDKQDARFALGLGVDFLALSFVRQASDIKALKSLIEACDCTAAVIAKIEKPEALTCADEILDAADAIMVARGDLGVELAAEEVPVAQSQLIESARSRFKPVIVATQMLESMIDHARPTRAEVTDIAHAVTQGADALMLSAETAAGDFPVDAVAMMDRIARQTEAHLWRNHIYGNLTEKTDAPPLPIWRVIAKATAQMSKELMAHAVVVISHSGMSAATMSSSRPAAPIIAITDNEEACRRMTLLWGVVPVLAGQAGSTNPSTLARETALAMKLAKPGEHVLLVRGFHSEAKMNTPSITTLTV